MERDTGYDPKDKWSLTGLLRSMEVEIHWVDPLIRRLDPPPEPLIDIQELTGTSGPG